MAEGIDFFPLRYTADSDLQRLGQCLWGWQLCNHCSGKPTCSNAQCSWGRAKRQAAFWTRYKTLTATYVPELFSPRPALRSHGDLLDLIQLIQCQSHSTREEIIQHHFVEQRIGDAEAPATLDQHRAMDLAASILFSVDCGNTCERLNLLEEGSSSLPWRNGVSAHDFLLEAFPKTSNSSIASGKGRIEWQVVTAAVSAKELRRVLELRLEATTDLRSHLLLDREKGVLKIFHCMAMLKETLLVSASQPTTCMLPRQFVLEVFDTVYNVLFPSDRESQALLSSLVARHGFDEDLLRYESWDRYGHNETILSYPYFGNRLAELYEELQNPKPRTRLESWFERKSGARYMLMATMIGVFIAVIIGILGLGISGFQAYVSYQQWKHPVKDA